MSKVICYLKTWSWAGERQEGHFAGTLLGAEFASLTGIRRPPVPSDRGSFLLKSGAGCTCASPVHVSDSAEMSFSSVSHVTTS